MTTQRLLDMAEACRRYDSGEENAAFAAGAEYGRKQVFERLLDSTEDPVTLLWLKLHMKTMGTK